jgi:hypothetical protein
MSCAGQSTAESRVWFSRHAACGARGMLRRRIPEAAKIALPTAGASPTRPVSPAPAEGRSLRSIEHDLNLRRVAEPGNAVLREVGVQNAAIRQRESSRRARRRCPEQWRPESWLRKPSGFTMAPHSQA